MVELGYLPGTSLLKGVVRRRNGDQGVVRDVRLRGHFEESGRIDIGWDLDVQGAIEGKDRNAEGAMAAALAVD